VSVTDNTTGGRQILEGILPVAITLTDTCEVGDLIGYDPTSTEVWERADANAKKYANLIAAQRCEVSGNTVKCYREAIVDGFTGGAAGKLIYLSDTDGQYAGKPTGNYHQVVGMFVDTTKAIIRPDSMPVMSYSSEADSEGLAEAGFFRCELMDGTGASMMGGVKIETKVNTTADTIPSIRSLYIYHQANADSTSGEDNVIVRLEDGGSTAANCYIEFSGTNAAGPSALFHFITDSGTCYSQTGALTLTQSGWLKVLFELTTTRYIALYSA